jgi:hypothetical protein
MWISTTLAGAAVAMTALLATSVATPAGADPTPLEPTRVALADGTGDVWVIGPGEDDWDPFGERATIDTVAGTARHRAHAVTASLAFLDLRRVQSKDFDVRMRTGAGTYRAIVSTDAEHPDGRHRLIDRSESRVACPGLAHEVDYAADTVRIRVPRSCLGSPPWVRVALSAYLFRIWDTLSDNPHNDGPEATLTERLPHE